MKKIPFGTLIMLFFCFVIAYILRSYVISSHLFFGPEQGRDLLVVRDIVFSHKLTLIGSKTDISGIFHGPVFYYLTAIPFALSGGNPLSISVFYLLLHSIGVYLIFLLTYELTKKTTPAVWSAILYAVSFGLIINARWLSNPPLSIPLSIVFMIFLVRFIQGKHWNLLGVGITYALLGQVEFINYVLFGCMGILFMLKYFRIVRKVQFHIIAVSLLATIALSIGNYLIFDLRHNFLILKSVVKLLTDSGNSMTIGATFKNVFEVFFGQVAYSMGIFSWIYGLITVVTVTLVLLKLRKKNPYYDLIIIWILISPLILFVLRRDTMQQFFEGSLAGYILAVVLTIYSLFKKNYYIGLVVFGLVLFQNIFSYVKFIPSNSQTFFQAPQPSVRYSDQLQVIHEIYKRANGKPFYFQAYTIPNFWQDAWYYLFWYIGHSRYGYIPKEGNKSRVFVIIQKDTSNAFFQKKWYEQTVSKWGTRKEGFIFGEYTVEERQL